MTTTDYKPQAVEEKWQRYWKDQDSFRVTDRLSDSDRAVLMGGTLQKVYGWAPSKA